MYTLFRDQGLASVWFYSKHCAISETSKWGLLQQVNCSWSSTEPSAAELQSNPPLLRAVLFLVLNRETD